MTHDLSTGDRVRITRNQEHVSEGDVLKVTGIDTQAGWVLFGGLNPGSRLKLPIDICESVTEKVKEDNDLEKRAEQDRAMLHSIINALKNWSYGMRDPDGKDCSAAVIRLLQSDIESYLGQDHPFDF